MSSLYDVQGALAKGRFRFARRHLGALDGMRVLEIGCGGGWNLLPFADAGCAVRGYDYDEEYLHEGSKRGLDLRMGGLSAALAANEKADLILLSHVLEHFLDPQETLHQIRSLLTDKGVLFVEVPNLFAIRDRLMRSLQGVHTYTFVPRTLERLMNRAGWGRVALNPVIQSLWRPASAREPAPWPVDESLARETQRFLLRWQDAHPLLSRMRAVGERLGAAAATIGLLD
ncbi:class I SAM-dependent methyltransferase [Rhodocyclus tenuis]|uniref:SAM-dependent methyltransferase n=1 Tax=Rhodocyclus tenuis TaxID=1066 RepID=A0A840G6F8_RHOTE|nr:class I SAM-dependent methyltransferase [Rhodocyclus tenuis]MBB4246308.1 SAM-dependent methyltransferase [Rhodocyclus tenuis]